MKYVIGIDYGTQSARAVLVSAEDGSVCASHTVRYPHGVMDGSLASVEDYDDALVELLSAMADSGHAEEIAGICLDGTSLTLVPLDRDFVPLARRPELSGRTHAQIKLWKRHNAQPQSEEAIRLAEERGERFLARSGGTISSEWMLPKLMELRDEDPLCWKTMDYAVDLCDYLSFRMTGVLRRSAGSMGFKCHYFPDLGLPRESYLDALRPGFGAEYAHLLRGERALPGDRLGTLRDELALRCSLPLGIPVAAGVIDGHTSLVSLGALQAGDAALVVGTSTVLTIQSKELREIEGICGIAQDGFTAGMFGIESGQGCTGDMLEWYITHALPHSVQEEAAKRSISPHQLLASSVENPWENRVTAADWWNGSRNTPCDLTLSGAIAGLTLESRAEHIYLALLQSMVCGTRSIMETCAAQGVEVKRLLATGGMARKSPALMQQYANILRMPIAVGDADEGPATGSAIFAAVASGIYETPLAAWEHMGIRSFTTYHPDTEHADAYEALYRRNCSLRNALIGMERL